MTSIEIRKATAGDAEAITSVLVRAFAEFESRYTPEGFSATTISAEKARKRLEEGPGWVAILDGSIVGTASAVPRNSALYVRGMGVVPEARGLRIGSSLLQRIDEFAAAGRYDRLFLHTAPFLTHAIRLYEHNGFCRTPESYDFHGQQLLTMVKTMDPRYPIGHFTWSGSNTPEQRTHLIDEIASTPQRMRSAVAGLSEDQLNTPYRDGGWTVRQVVHHLPDSHMNSYIRCKFALTLHEPTIMAYDEARWAQLVDAEKAPIEPSLNLLEGLHHRWAMLFRSLSQKDVERRFHHPELGVVTIDQYIALYAWHGAHHVAHITALRERKGWR